MPIHDYIERLDTELQFIPDDGDKAAHLNRHLNLCERNLRLLEAWSRDETAGPNPLGENVDAFDVLRALDAVHKRLNEVRGRIDARIRRVEREIARLPYVPDHSHPNGFRVIQGGLR